MSLLTRFTVSVVIPAYNAAPYIERALTSVLNQTRLPDEVLITNDGSTDNTLEVLERFVARHPILGGSISSQPNRGIGAARNSGLSRASGDFVAFLDADDVWYPNKLERVCALISQSPTVDVVYHDEVEVQIDGRRSNNRYGALGNDPYEHLLFRGNCLSTSATVVRRSLAVRLDGFSEDMRFNSAEDYDLWLRFAASGASFHYLAETLGEYVRVPTSVTARIGYNAERAFNVYAHHVDTMRRTGKLTDAQFARAMRIGAGTLESRRARTHYLFGDAGQAVGLYASAIAKWPFAWKPYAGLALALTRRLITR